MCVVEAQPIDIVLTAMVGYAGLKPTINAINSIFKFGDEITTFHRRKLIFKTFFCGVYAIFS